jgi:hypothetical protein
MLAHDSIDYMNTGKYDKIDIDSLERQAIVGNEQQVKGTNEQQQEQEEQQQQQKVNYSFSISNSDFTISIPNRRLLLEHGIKIDQTLHIIHGFADSIREQDGGAIARLIFVCKACVLLDEAIDGRRRDYPTVDDIQTEFFKAIGKGETYIRFLRMQKELMGSV